MRRTMLAVLGVALLTGACGGGNGAEAGGVDPNASTSEGAGAVEGEVAAAVAAGSEGPAATADAAPALPAARGRSGASVWEGPVTGGYQGSKISFEISPTGEISEILFEGHWNCASGLEMTFLGPDGSYPVSNGAIDIVSVDPPDGGSTAMRFVFNGTVSGSRASGQLRGNLNALGCDTGLLSWEATPSR